MSRLLALDPGIRGCGVALFEGEIRLANGSTIAHHPRLVACDYVKNPVKKGDDFGAVIAMAGQVHDWVLMENGNTPWLLVAEWPRIYTVSKSKGDNNELLPLVGVGCAVATFATSATRVFPHEWKHQLSKEVCHQRIRSRLDMNETNVLNDACARAKSLAHNTLDAVGIGLHHTGRFAPKKSWEP